MLMKSICNQTCTPRALYISYYFLIKMTKEIQICTIYSNFLDNICLISSADLLLRTFLYALWDLTKIHNKQVVQRSVISSDFIDFLCSRLANACLLNCPSQELTSYIRKTRQEIFIFHNSRFHFRLVFHTASCEELQNIFLIFKLDSMPQNLSVPFIVNFPAGVNLKTIITLSHLGGP